MIQSPASPIGVRFVPAKSRQSRMASARQHPSAGFWRALPLALALGAGWWTIGLATVAALAHWR